MNGPYPWYGNWMDRFDIKFELSFVLFWQQHVGLIKLRYFIYVIAFAAVLNRNSSEGLFMYRYKNKYIIFSELNQTKPVSYMYIYIVIMNSIKLVNTIALFTITWILLNVASETVQLQKGSICQSYRDGRTKSFSCKIINCNAIVS